MAWYDEFLKGNSLIGGAGGHRAVRVMPNPIPVVNNPPYGVAPYTPTNPVGGGGQDVMPPNTFIPTVPMMGTPAHGNVFGGGANISDEGGMNVFERLGLDKDFLGAALASIGDFGKPAMRSARGGGGGGGGGGARVGGNVKPTGLMAPTLPDIPAVAPNPGFYTLLPRQQKDRYSGGF